MVSVVVLAAGLGTRMKSDLPKVLHKICGREMIYFSLKEAFKISDDVTVVLYHQADKIQQIIKNEFPNVKIKIQDLENYPGTGGAIRDIEYIHENVLVLNGDMPLVESSELENFFKCDADIVMGVIELENPDGYGRVIINNGEVEKIVEQKDATDEIKRVKFVNSGVYSFKRAILEKYVPKLSNSNAQKEYYLTDVIELTKLDNHHVKAIFVKEENFKGVNSRYDLANAEVIKNERILKKFMLQGVTIKLPHTVYIEEGVEIEGDCVIESGVSLIGNTKIKNSHIKTNSIIESSIIENSDIGPMSRVRPQSVIKNSHIGNFVEVKKSNLNGVKAGHLSYLGDSEIDEGTNIGAGTITCNYDGKGKYKTIIGKNVFIGSDTQLVAPVVIADDCIIAAGTTVTKDVEKGSLAISREPLKFVKDFYYKFFSK